jgi:predicted nucleic acid-binding protein
MQQCAKEFIETTIPSFYYETRKEPEMVARRIWTRHWWDNSKKNYELISSAPVIDELARGNYTTKKKTLQLMDDIKLVSVGKPILDIVQIYIQNNVMPHDPLGDALHLALASFHKCDYLLTWNCKHLANANKFQHIKRVNAMLDLYVPMLITPLELIEGE